MWANNMSYLLGSSCTLIGVRGLGRADPIGRISIEATSGLRSAVDRDVFRVLQYTIAPAIQPDNIIIPVNTASTISAVLFGRTFVGGGHGVAGGHVTVGQERLANFSNAA